ncbi:6-phosphogluconolactonase [Lutibacter oceani]|uniref:6-phosphogluconolactonase n=1 Tax=Lutibacter oceani TaxID=1853311 RepID=A0A3D9S2W2_9FLAO|nr:lactonase family protein [Lutibacter oceani]REE83656.1 6-phosphogluconolactonase [Lutibacter oceani]
MKITFFTLLLSISFVTYSQNISLYVGTYTGADSEGIYKYDFNTKTGELSNKKLVAKAENPSFITFSSDKKHLYSVSENGENSNINAFSVGKNGMLNFINQASSNGANPCHVQLNKNNTKAVISNYTGGTISIYNIEKNGSVNEAFQVLDHNTETKKSHAHSAKFFKNNLFIADLGRDFLAQYDKNDSKYSLKENFKMKEGAGPRHFEISKKGKFIYVINELNSTVSVLKKDKESYTNIQNISTLSDDFNNESFCADIHLSKNERFLYGSNRGENSIVVFKRDKKNGTLQKIQNIPVHGNWPRNFTIAPDGKFLLVANQKSKNISVYKVNKSSGKLTFLHSIEAPTPVCLLF